jgi:tetratricopeptide (TPR) repeat protein
MAIKIMKLSEVMRIPFPFEIVRRIYLQIKNMPQAILFERILTLEPDSARDYYDLGVCYFDDKYDQAALIWNRPLRSANTAVYLYLGAVFFCKAIWSKPFLISRTDRRKMT